MFSVVVSRVNKSLAVLSLYCSVSYLFVANQHPRSFFCLILAYVGISIICILSRAKDTYPFMLGFIALALAQFILITLQIFNLDPFFHKVDNYNQSVVVGVVGSANQMAYFYALVAPYLGVFAIISAIAIFYSKCSTAAVAFLIGMFIYNYIYYKSRAVILTVIVLIFCMAMWNRFDTPMGSFKERIIVWKLSIEQLVRGEAKQQLSEDRHNIRIIKGNLFLGYGIGKFAIVSPNSQSERLGHRQHIYEHAHNDYIEYVYDFGLVGCLIIFFVIKSFFEKLIKIQWNRYNTKILISMVIQLICMIGVYSIHAPSSYLMFCITVGLLYAEANNVKNEKTKTVT